jgi:hypothetical protein
MDDANSAIDDAEQVEADVGRVGGDEHIEERETLLIMC